MTLKNVYMTLISAVVVPVTAMADNTIPASSEEYMLVWHDEFNDSVLNERAWNIEVNGDGGHNAENQKRKGHGVFLRLRWCAVLDGLRLLGDELEVKLGAGCRGALEQYRRSLQK